MPGEGFIHGSGFTVVTSATLFNQILNVLLLLLLPFLYPKLFFFPSTFLVVFLDVGDPVLYLNRKGGRKGHQN